MATYPCEGSSALRVEGDATLDQRGVEEVWADFLAYFGERISLRELNAGSDLLRHFAWRDAYTHNTCPDNLFSRMLKAVMHISSQRC